MKKDPMRQGSAQPTGPLEPSGPLSAGQELLSDAQVVRWTWVLVAIGIVARVVRYALRFPIWGDEAFVAVNFIDRGFLDLVRPLDYHQVCPLGFLWLELAAVRLGGFN